MAEIPDSVSKLHAEQTLDLVALRARIRELEQERSARDERIKQYDVQLAEWMKRARELEQERDREKASKDTAYSERDQLVCALSKLLPSHLERHPDSDLEWENDWRWIVFIQFPTGQGSWHIHDSEIAWFDHLTRTGGNTWDGHSTAEKYARVRLEVQQVMNYLQAQLQACEGKLREALKVIHENGK